LRYGFARGHTLLIRQAKFGVKIIGINQVVRVFFQNQLAQWLHQLTKQTPNYVADFNRPLPILKTVFFFILTYDAHEVLSLQSYYVVGLGLNLTS
jgi:hypothetical protein